MDNDALARELIGIGHSNFRLLGRGVLARAAAEYPGLADVIAAMETNRKRQCELLTEVLARAKAQGLVGDVTANAGTEPKDGGKP